MAGVGSSGLPALPELLLGCSVAAVQVGYVSDVVPRAPGSVGFSSSGFLIIFIPSSSGADVSLV